MQHINNQLLRTQHDLSVTKSQKNSRLCVVQTAPEMLLSPAWEGFAKKELSHNDETHYQDDYHISISSGRKIHTNL